MSEYVEKSLQESLFELKYMKQIGLFTDEELGKILKKRREHEYKIRRRTKELKEYMDYIEYEKLVLELIKKRRKDMNCYNERRKIEIPIYKRIRRQFQNACSRFPHCADLWVKQIEFCIEKNETMMIGSLFTNALRLHPRNESIWIMAAKHEMEDNSSMADARNFLLRALRQNTTSKTLYLEYFRMELLNAETLRGEDVLKVKGGDNESLEDGAAEEIARGAVALVVFETAVQEITGDLSFYISFVNICKFFPFAHWIVDQIYDSISCSAYWQGKEEAVAVVSFRPLSSFMQQLSCVRKDGEEERLKKLFSTFGACVKECRQEFHTARQLFPSGRMWQVQLDLILESSKQAADVIKQELLQEGMLLCCQAFKADVMTEKMALQWISLLNTNLSFGSNMACLLVHKWPSNIAMWLFLFQQLGQQSSPEASADDVLGWLRECNSIANKDAALVQVWKLALQWLVSRNYPDVEKVFELGILTGSREVKRCVKEVYLAWMGHNKEIGEVRKGFERLFKNRPNSKELLNIYVKAELSQSPVSAAAIRRAYDIAVSELGDTCVDLWLEYIKFEASHDGSSQFIGQIYYNAVKSLNSGLENEFIEKYTILKTSNFEI